jgi:hypothetical protein
MREEELIKEMENVELPDIELQSHRRRLRMALLDAGYHQRRRRYAFPEIIIIFIKGVIETMIKGLVSRQPVWKTATVSIIAVALVLGLSLTLPQSSNSVYAQAEEITQNDPGVKAALGGGEVQVVKIDITDNEGTVLAKGKTGIVSVSVDFKANKVTEVETYKIDEQVAIDIVKDDPRVKELISAGAMIGEVSTIYLSGQTGNVKTGEFGEFVEIIVMVEIVQGETGYIARVDMNEGIITSLTDKSSDTTPPGLPKSFSIPDTQAQTTGTMN